MVVNLTENRFLQQAQKIEPPKKLELPWNYLSYLSSYQFHLLLMLQYYFGRLFHGVSLSSIKRGDIFHKNLFLRGFIGGIILHGGTDDQIIETEEVFSKNAFPSNLNTVNPKISHNHCEIFTWIKGPVYSVELWKG